MNNTPNTVKGKDLANQPVSAMLWWGLPIAIGVIVALLHLSLRLSAGICAVSFAWMATGCFLNAMRCHRLHCYISGPAFLLGTFFAALIASGVTALGPQIFSNGVMAILVLAGLSFVPEMVWKRYV